MDPNPKRQSAGVWLLAAAVFAWCFVDCSCSAGQPGETSEEAGQEVGPDGAKKKRSHRHKRKHKDRHSPSGLPEGVPEKAGKVLAYIDQHGRAPQGYVGGRTFSNRERHLPRTDRDGKPVRYREWDVNPKVRGKNRGPERLVTGSEGSAYYTPDHYRTFVQIR